MLTDDDRRARYARQAGPGTRPLTGPQRRRMKHKAARARDAAPRRDAAAAARTARDAAAAQARDAELLGRRLPLQLPPLG
jgi:hypothetical protein